MSSYYTVFNKLKPYFCFTKIIITVKYSAVQCSAVKFSADVNSNSCRMRCTLLKPDGFTYQESMLGNNT